MEIDQDIAQRAYDLVNRYFDALNAGDADGVTDTLNFPHFRIGSKGNVIHYPDRNSNHLGNFHSRTLANGWARSVIDRMEVFTTLPTMAHIGVWFRRLRADETEIGSFYSMYVITNVDGHWGLQGGSGNGM